MKLVISGVLLVAVWQLGCTCTIGVSGGIKEIYNIGALHIYHSDQYMMDFHPILNASWASQEKAQRKDGGTIYFLFDARQNVGDICDLGRVSRFVSVCGRMPIHSSPGNELNIVLEGIGIGVHVVVRVGQTNVIEGGLMGSSSTQSPFHPGNLQEEFCIQINLLYQKIQVDFRYIVQNWNKNILPNFPSVSSRINLNRLQINGEFQVTEVKSM